MEITWNQNLKMHNWYCIIVTVNWNAMQYLEEKIPTSNKLLITVNGQWNWIWRVNIPLKLEFYKKIKYIYIANYETSYEIYRKTAKLDGKFD